MTGSDRAWLILVTIPVWIVIGSTVLHLVRRTDIGTPRKLLWLGLVLLAPVVGTVVYLVVRPLPLVDVPEPGSGGPGRQLADAVVRHDRGELDRPSFEGELRRLLAPVVGRTAYQESDE